MFYWGACLKTGRENLAPQATSIEGWGEETCVALIVIIVKARFDYAPA
jgi:hypothetical protein